MTDQVNEAVQYRKKPVVIEAMQLAADPSHEFNDALHAFMAGCDWCSDRDGIQIETLEGTMHASPGDWIIKGVKGEFYPCKPDIFAATYEPAANPARGVVDELTADEVRDLWMATDADGITMTEHLCRFAKRIQAGPVEVDEHWQLIDSHRSPDGMTYTATYWCANTGALKTETTSDGRFRAGEGPRIRRPTLARQLAEAKAELAEAKEQRDALVSEYERAVGCGEQGYVHALMHLFNAITNAKIDAKVAERQLVAAHPSRGVVDEAIDERASFEADYLRRFNAPGRLGMNAEGRYGHLMTRCRFEGWQARAALQAAALPSVPAFDMLAHLQRQRKWSGRTFGPGPRTAGVIDHIRKELREIEADPTDLSEWIDVVILALDGAWRAGGTPEQIIATLVAKQTKNEGRTWPDWRTVSPDKAIEHDRTQDACSGCFRHSCNGECMHGD